MKPTKQCCLFLAVLVLFVLNLFGCSEELPKPATGDEGGVAKEIYGVLNGDADEDLWGDGNGSLQAHAEQVCKDASSEGKPECVATMVAALKGSGDCDFVIADDPTVCFDGGLDCVDEKYSVCAPCINPGAEEVVDGVDNDCDGKPAPGECFTGKPCDDENACTTADTCSDGACEGAPKDCNDLNPCTDDSCDSALGCLNENNDAQCDDGNACTDTDTCANGTCVGLVINCNDGNECTDDTCEIFSGCHNATNTAACEDGNLCTDNDVCADGVCVAGPAKDCSDPNLCTDDSCDALFGCVYKAKDCDDGDACTLDSCNSQIGCVNTAIVCDDGDACNGVETCDKATGCVQGVALNCDDENLCTDDSCDALAGCQHVNNSNQCTDGNVCTNGDACANGACVAGPALNCNDGDDCTTDSCDPVTECAHSPISDCCQEDADCAPPPAGFVPVPGETFWSDGTYSFGCLPSTDPLVTYGVCLKCEDADADGWCDLSEQFCADGVDGDLDGDTDCVDQDCDGKTCSDGDKCTTGDVCTGGVCVAGPATNCNDADACTTDSCDPATGCAHAAVSCDDVNLCTTDSCAPATGCAHAAVSCDDGNDCTADSCNPATGCAHDLVEGCCAVDDDCAGATEVCWLDQCTQVALGECAPFGVIATTLSPLQWWGGLGEYLGLTSASGPPTLDVAPATACSGIVYGNPAVCTCVTHLGTSPCGEMPASPGQIGCWHSKVAAP